jgi:hypothetical protein
MPMLLSADPADRFAVLTATDPYTIEEWRSAMAALLEHAVYRARGAVLVDRRTCTPPDSAFVSEMNLFFTRRKSDVSIMIAAVVVSNDAGFDMGQKTERANPDASIRTFRSYEDAKRWLIRRSPLPGA